VCCSVLQCVAVCCSVLQCAAVCCSVLQCVAVCCSVLQSAVVCSCLLQCVAVCCSLRCNEAVRHEPDVCLRESQKGKCDDSMRLRKLRCNMHKQKVIYNYIWVKNGLIT